MTTEPDQIPDWVTVGAEVVLYTDGPRASRDVVTTTIKRVTATTFTVADEYAPRFQLKRRQFDGPGYAIQIGGAWGSDRVCVPFGSPEAQQEIRTHNRHRRERSAENAFVTWAKSRSKSDLEKLIEVLQVIDQYDELETKP